MVRKANAMVWTKRTIWKNSKAWLMAGKDRVKHRARIIIGNRRKARWSKRNHQSSISAQKRKTIARSTRYTMAKTLDGMGRCLRWMLFQTQLSDLFLRIRMCKTLVKKLMRRWIFKSTKRKILSPAHRCYTITKAQKSVLRSTRYHLRLVNQDREMSISNMVKLAWQRSSKDFSRA